MFIHQNRPEICRMRGRMSSSCFQQCSWLFARPFSFWLVKQKKVGVELCFWLEYFVHFNICARVFAGHGFINRLQSSVNNTLRDFWFIDWLWIYKVFQDNRLLPDPPSAVPGRVEISKFVFQQDVSLLQYFLEFKSAVLPAGSAKHCKLEKHHSRPHTSGVARWPHMQIIWPIWIGDSAPT